MSDAKNVTSYHVCVCVSVSFINEKCRMDAALNVKEASLRQND